MTGAMPIGVKRRGAWGTVAMTSLVSIGKNADVLGKSQR
jgi:hypothetical protein